MCCGPVSSTSSNAEKWVGPDASCGGRDSYRLLDVARCVGARERDVESPITNFGTESGELGFVEDRWFLEPDRFSISSEVAATPTVDATRFLPRDMPPPPCATMSLLPTTFTVAASPVLVSNLVLDFLEASLATIVKVNCSKFTVKAVATVEGLECVLKIRVYRQGTGCAVEFNRRSGDGLAFGALFRQARDVVGGTAAFSTSVGRS
mmetsp:Transcript_54055/g.144545  ORF Transcript_54055/g.144545 Transcript_54055/m.144545 type:complete len:207 (-) Transcript_54055:193-813(-)